MDYIPSIIDYFNDINKTIQKLDIKSISNFINLMHAASTSGKKIYICGNGGSASTASHFTSDFMKGLSDLHFNVECLCDNISIITSIANDSDYSEIFKQQLKDRVTCNDIVIGISGSGNSENVIKAINLAKLNGATTVGITGYDGGKLSKIVDLSINFPINDMQIAEDFHLILNHMTMKILKGAEKE